MAIVEAAAPAADGRRRLSLSNPATLEPLGEIEVASAAEVRAAISRARAAQPAWAALGFDERAAYLRRALRILVERQDAYLDVICAETGKARMEALMIEIIASCDFLAYWSKRAKRILADRKRRMHLLSPMKTLRIVYRPLGVAAIITPWNAPFVLSVNPTAQALMAGNSVVLKPSEVTANSGKLVGELFAAAGLPEGVLEVVTGDGETGAALLEGGVDKVSFTGSVATGRKVGEACGRQLIPCTLELGGKDPFIVCADADVERAARGAVFGAFMNAGQVCMGVERVYVVDEVADAFTERVLDLTRTLRQSDHGEFDVGSIFWPRQLDVIERHMEQARAAGAKVLIGGRRNPDLRGLYYEPTVLTDVTQDMAIMREETFGPVMPIMRVRDEDEAIHLANDTSYGLTASVWTRDLAKGAAYGRRLAVGSVCVNDTSMTYGATEAPFGGVAQSGVGRVNGEEGLRSYCYSQPIIVDRFGRKDEPAWYPFTSSKLRNFQRFVRVMWGTRLWRLLS